MKNIITILLILILPIMAYLIVDKRASLSIANAKENNLPTVMTFSSTMCLDCQKLKVVLKEVEETYRGKVNFINYNALDKDRKIKEYIKKYNIVLAPTTIIFDENGKDVDRIEGYIPKEELINEIEEALNG